MRYLAVTLALIVPVFAVRTAVTAYRSTIEHPKWWTFVCLLCAPVTTLNLSSGEVSASLLSFNLFGLGYWHMLPDGPWFLQVAFPAGAVLFLNRRRKLLAAARPLCPEDQLPD
jgi:hypothetical protein